MLFKYQSQFCAFVVKNRRFFKDQTGATAVEYSLLAAIIAVSLYIALGVYYEALNNLFNFIITTMSNALS
jgi:pilus assembly protein Flp/PilA